MPKFKDKKVAAIAMMKKQISEPERKDISDLDKIVGRIAGISAKHAASLKDFCRILFAISAIKSELNNPNTQHRL